MPIQLEISCITKREYHNPHERILGVGGITANGRRFWYDESDAIMYIRTGAYEFFVNVGHRVKVEIATRNGRDYLKTEPDDYAPNNLLNLPDCPR